MGNRISGKVTKEKTYGSRARVQRSLAVASAVGARPSGPSRYSNSMILVLFVRLWVRAPQSYNALWSENMAIRWHHPREAGNRTRRVASEEGDWAASMLGSGS